MRRAGIASLLVSVALLAAGPTRTVVSKFSGKEQCAKPDPSYVVPVGDRTDHVLSLSKYKCTWTQGEVLGIHAKGEDGTGVSDITGNTGHDHGYAVATYANGDTTVSRYQGTTTFKDNAPVSSQGTWTLLSATGRMKGISGKGTYTGRFDADGTSTFEVVGEFRTPTATSAK